MIHKERMITMSQEIQENQIIRRIWVPGCSFCDSCGDGTTDKVSITFEIPGVKKGDIDLRLIPDGMRLVAKKDAYTEYVSEYLFNCPADVENAKANYSDGVLNVEIQLTCKDPFDDAKLVDVS